MAAPMITLVNPDAFLNNGRMKLLSQQEQAETTRCPLKHFLLGALCAPLTLLRTCFARNKSENPNHEIRNQRAFFAPRAEVDTDGR